MRNLFISVALSACMAMYANVVSGQEDSVQTPNAEPPAVAAESAGGTPEVTAGAPPASRGEPAGKVPEATEEKEPSPEDETVSEGKAASEEKTASGKRKKKRHHRRGRHRRNRGKQTHPEGSENPAAAASSNTGQ
ncbi:MAG: hypothetical protein LBD66_01300 [Holosporales bacterium]|nr:hypothetical protein [Holosporales bacterium]